MTAKRLVFLLIGLGSGVFAFGIPQYQIFDIGVLSTHTVSQGFRISPNGIATGRSVGTGIANAYTFTTGGGLVGLPNFTGRNYSVGNGVNNSGVVVGTGATTLSGASPLPLIWQSGSVSQLALAAGQTLGRANDINNSNVAVGSNGGGSLERGVVYSGGSASFITSTGPGGTFFTTAFGVNDSGMVAGIGIDPNNAARNVGLVHNIGAGTTIEVGALAGMNGALAFDISEAGHVVGSSMLNQGFGTPFIWTSGGGMTAIPFAVGTSQGSARGVNSAGWAVGTMSSAFAIPFLYDGVSTFRVGDVIVNGAGWDLLTNTSSSALGIAEDGTIVGTAVFNGNIHGYVAVPVPEPATLTVCAGAIIALLRRRRK